MRYRILLAPILVGELWCWRQAMVLVPSNCCSVLMNVKLCGLFIIILVPDSAPAISTSSATLALLVLHTFFFFFFLIIDFTWQLIMTISLYIYMHKYSCHNFKHCDTFNEIWKHVPNNIKTLFWQIKQGRHHLTTNFFKTFFSLKDNAFFPHNILSNIDKLNCAAWSEVSVFVFHSAFE